MKFRVQLLLCGGLLLSSLESQSAQNLSDDSRASLNVEISAKVSTDRPRKSGPETQSERSQSTSKFVTVDDTRLHFVIKGEGRPVVLIHGNPGSGQDWTRVFGPLSGLHKVIAFDRPGHGRSERPKHIDVTVEVQARLLHDALKQLHVERPIVVGHSWGGALALVYAINYPQEVAGVVLNDSLKQFSPRYPEITIPVSILAGDSDLIVPEKKNAERLHQVLPKSRLILLPKTGHQIPFTRSQAVVDEIERIQKLSRVRTL